MAGLMSGMFCKSENSKIKAYETQIIQLQTILKPVIPETLISKAQFYVDQNGKLWQLNDTLDKANKQYLGNQQSYVNQISELQKKLSALTQPSELEKSVVGKYPIRNVLYPARTIEGNSFIVDPRCFFANTRCSELQNIASGWSNLDDDSKAFNAVRWVQNSIRYIGDDVTWKTPEYWQLFNETLQLRTGDCEDGAIVIANLCRAAGIPYYKVRITAGDVFNSNGVKAGGHCYVTYLCESTNRWVTLDWCFYPNANPINQRPDYKTEKIYGGDKSIWFSLDEKNCYSNLPNTQFATILG